MQTARLDIMQAKHDNFNFKLYIEILLGDARKY